MSQQPKIIFITGTLGAGKGTIVDILSRLFGFQHYSVRNYLLSVLSERQLPPDRDHMTLIANELRAHHGGAYIIEQLYAEATRSRQPAVIESVRAPAEVTFIKTLSGSALLAVDALVSLRYKRVTALRKQSTDNISFGEFLSHEARELHAIDPNQQQLAYCIKAAEICFMNNATIDALEQDVVSYLHRTYQLIPHRNTSS